MVCCASEGAEKGRENVDENQQRQVDEAAEKFAQAIADSYRAVAERGVSAQQLNAELTQSFFNGVIDSLRAQAEGSRDLARELANQQQRQREATQDLAQASVGAYMEFLNSMFSYYQGSMEQTRRDIRR